MHDIPPVTDLGATTVSSNGHLPNTPVSDVENPARAGKWASRLTSIIGLICLLSALLLWAARQNHYRQVLALLTIAMFAAILHAYTSDDGSQQ